MVRPLKQLCNCTVKQFPTIFWRRTGASSLLPVQESMSQRYDCKQLEANATK